TAFRGARERLEQAAPVPFGVENPAHLVATCSEAVEATMFQLDAGVPAVGDETDFELGLEVRVVLPVGIDVPGQQKAGVRFPPAAAAPAPGAATAPPLVPAPPDPGFDARVPRGGLADFVVSQRPPGSHLRGESPPCHLLRGPNGHDLAHAVRV